MSKTIVTRESIQTMLNHPNPRYVEQVVGRALVALFQRQTEFEKMNNHTSTQNGVGFAGCDARSGSLTAKAFIKHNRLTNWQVEKWTTIGSSGYAKLCKYHKQLNEIAVAKQSSLGGTV